MDENNVIIRITGEADLSNAEEQVRSLKDRNKELTDQLKRLQEQERADAKDIENTIKDRAQLSAKLKENADYYKREAGFINQDIDANKRNIKTLQQSVNQYNALSGAGVKMRQQLMAMREEMTRMAEAGDTTSARFIELADQASTLSDTLGDAQAVITLLASDTKNLDAAMQVGGGLIGTFNAATSAMALLGGESEELQQAFLKVQAAMALLQGVQQVMTVLDKRSAANVVIRTAAIKLLNKVKGQQAATETATTEITTTDTAAQTTNTIATKMSTAAIKAKDVAMKILNKTILANPVMWLVAGLAALAAGLMAIVSHSKKAAEAQRNFSGELERTRKINSQLASDSDFAARMAEAEGKGWREVLAIQRESAQKQLSNADNLIENMHEKQRKAKGKLSDDEKAAMQEALDMQKEANDALLKLNKDYNVQEAAERTAAAKQREEDLKAELDRRKELLIQAAEDERTARQVLEHLNSKEYKQEQKKAEEQRKAEYEKAMQEEREEDVNVADFQSALDYAAKRMQLEGATEDEIYQYRFNTEMKYWQKKLATAEVGSQEYIDISNKIADMEIENNNRVADSNAQKLQDVIDIAGQALNTLGQMTNEIFGAISDSIQAQIEQLDEMYTTDAEEAKKDASKKYISEKELEEKKAKLKLKQQKLDKANAIFQIGLSTAQAIMSIWGMPGVPVALKIAQTVMASALGATQLAVAAAKPLSQYAKGRKGGQGEYALVGEKGAEIMYVPQGASIIPHSKIDQPEAWGAYGVPQLPIPASANINPALLDQAVAASQWQPIDYDRLGQAVAKAMPKQRAVNVNVDRHGVTVQSGNDTRTYLNTKYQAQW